jgi:hypothetical protein
LVLAIVREEVEVKVEKEVVVLSEGARSEVVREVVKEVVAKARVHLGLVEVQVVVREDLAY